MILTVFGCRGLKTLPSSTVDIKPTEVLFPDMFLKKEKASEVLKALAKDRQGLHNSRMWGSIVGLPLVFCAQHVSSHYKANLISRSFTIPVGLLPVIPNIPGFYV